MRISGPGFTGGVAATTGVARAHHRGQHELIGGVHRRNRLGPCHLHGDVIPRQQIGHGHLKHIRPVFLQQRRRLALALRRFIFRPRLDGLPDPGGDYPPAGGQCHPVNRRPGGCGKYIQGLERHGPGVAIALGEPHPRNRSIDRDPGKRRLERQLFGWLFIPVSEDLEIRGGGIGRWGKALDHGKGS